MALRTQPTAHQAGALIEITPGQVLEAVGLVRQGLVYDLAHQNGTVRLVAAGRHGARPEPVTAHA